LLLTIEAIQFDNSEFGLHTRIVECHARSRPAHFQTHSPAKLAGVFHATSVQRAVNEIKQKYHAGKAQNDYRKNQELPHHNEANLESRTTADSWRALRRRKGQRHPPAL
jgi:hypothetical protein